MIDKIRNYPVSSMYIAAIWILSFMDVPETPLSHVTLIDKWVHIAMYLGTCLTIWGEYKRRHRSAFAIFNARPNWGKLLLWAWIMPTVMSGVIELGQEYLTPHRSGDWLDLLANAIGTTLAMIAGAVFLYRKTSRR